MPDPLGSNMINTQPRIDCTICGAEGRPLYAALTDGLFGTPGSWGYSCCPYCGFVWLDPCPVPEDTAKLYENYYTHAADSGYTSQMPSLKTNLMSHVLAKYYGYDRFLPPQGSGLATTLLACLPFVRDIIGLNIMGLEASHIGRLLEVGSGSGRFLAIMRDLGWTVHGIEPDRRAAAVAQRAFQLPIHAGTIETAGFADGTFDVVVMNHVLEHAPDPTTLMIECRRVLKEGGRLVIITPNVQSIGHRLFRQSWRGLEPPRHLHLFSLSTLRLCADRAGLQVEVLRTTARSARGLWISSTWLRRHNQVSPQRVSRALWLVAASFQLIEHLFLTVSRTAGEEIHFVGIKSGEDESA